jgi:hypothetical protein
MELAEAFKLSGNVAHLVFEPIGAGDVLHLIPERILADRGVFPLLALAEFGWTVGAAIYLAAVVMGIAHERHS